MKAFASLCALTVITVTSSLSTKVEFPPEWHSWKLQNHKIYSSLNEELERHITWLSNQAYIDAYNSREHIFGFRLGMNEFGDMVGPCIYNTCCIYSVL